MRPTWAHLAGLTTRVDPTTDQARQWLVAELAKGDYHDTRSLFQRFMDWLAERIQDLQATQGTGSASLPPVVIALVVVLAGVAVAYLLTRVRREGRRTTTRTTLLGNSEQTAEELRAAAVEAFRAERYGDAVLAWTRAIARDAERRTLLDAAPSLTAHEVGAALATAFPDHAGDVGRTMDVFDAVAYGDQEASRGQAERVRATHDALRTARPVTVPRTPPGASGESGGTGGTNVQSPEPASVWTVGAPR